MAEKNILILGATGAMGKYLVPILAGKGYHIDAVSFDDVEENAFPNVRWIKGNAKEVNFRRELLSRHYDGIVDFLIYTTGELVSHLPAAVKAADHYIFLSTYRIYDGIEVPVRETSPRLLDSTQDVFLRNSDDYSIYKARGENILRGGFPEKNWTIIRPAITYSLLRYQLVTLEAPLTVGRALQGKTVILPETAKDVQATMSWAGDVAQMIAGLLFNEKALGETFTVATSEHHSWGEIAEYYKEICNLKALWVPQEDYLSYSFCGYRTNPRPYLWQLIYDRLFHRIMDNSKVLACTGMKQENLKKLYDGLEYEVSRCPKDYGEFASKQPANCRMDEYFLSGRK